MKYIILFNILYIMYILSFYDNEILYIRRSYTCNFVYKTNINNEVIIYFSNLIKNNRIMLIGVSNPYHSYKLHCSLLYRSYITNCNITVVKINLTFSVKNHINLTYVALYIKLKSKRKIDIPTGIKINKNIMPLLFYKPLRKYKIILAIVNFFNIKNYKQVIDVIELSKLYGVEHIVIYVTSSTLFIKSILYYYCKDKYIELIPFCFNSEIKYVHETGQIEKNNDVLYRYMYNTKYIIFCDIDEIIIPVGIKNYMSFISMTDNHSSDMYLFKSKLFPYFSNNYNSIIKNKKCCFIRTGYEKYIIGNLYKYDILSVHIYMKSFFPIKVNRINEIHGYVRHTRYMGKMCNTNIIDTSLEYLEFYLTKIYKKFEKMFNNNSYIYFYGKK